MRNHFYDIVQCTPLINTKNAEFVSNSYLWLNWGYVAVPPNVYFSGDFSVSVWIKIIEYGKWQRIFDFGNGPKNNDVLMHLSTDQLGFSLILLFLKYTFLIF